VPGVEFSGFLDYFWVGSASAVAMELLKLYELRGKLHSKKFSRLRRSPLFWIAVVGMAASSGFLAWAINANASDPTVLQVALSGIGAQSIVRKLIEARNANSGDINLGESDLRDAFL
jgi:hypothetical protein